MNSLNRRRVPFKVVTTSERVIVDPDTQEHTLTADELRKGREFVAKWFPALAISRWSPTILQCG